jgi:hypothetical protein
LVISITTRSSAVIPSDEKFDDGAPLEKRSRLFRDIAAPDPRDVVEEP